MPLPISKNKPKHSIQFEAIGTHWLIETVTPIDNGLRKQIDDAVELFDSAFSRFRVDSTVAKMAMTPGAYELPNSASELMQLYKELYDITNGAMSPLVGGQLEDAGYDSTYSLQKGTIRDATAWNDAMEWNGSQLTVKQPFTLDVGAAGKGKLVDIIGELLESNGYAQYVIDASGDIRQRGSEEEVIGLEDPNDASRVIGVARVHNNSLCASASNRRRWAGGMHHIIDPRTKTPVQDIIATWVVADSTMLADGLATALFFVDCQTIESHYNAQCVRLYSDGKLEYSHSFVGELFI